MWRCEDVKMWRCEDEKMWRWEDVRMWCKDVKMRRCEDVKVWGSEDVKTWGWEDVKIWGCEDVKMKRCEDVKMWRWEDVKMRRCEGEQMWRWEDVRMRRREDEKMWRFEGVKMWRWKDVRMWRCEDEKIWRCEDVKVSRCEDEKMWRCDDEKMRRWEDVRTWRCEDVRMWKREDEKMWRCEDVKMWRWKDVRMWRCEDVKMKRCEGEQIWRWEDVKMWRWEDVKMRRCEDVRMWGWDAVSIEDVMWRCEDVNMFERPPLLEQPFAQTLSGKTEVTPAWKWCSKPPKLWTLADSSYGRFGGPSNCLPSIRFQSQQVFLPPHQGACTWAQWLRRKIQPRDYGKQPETRGPKNIGFFDGRNVSSLNRLNPRSKFKTRVIIEPAGATLWKFIIVSNHYRTIRFQHGDARQHWDFTPYRSPLVKQWVGDRFIFVIYSSVTPSWNQIWNGTLLNGFSVEHHIQMPHVQSFRAGFHAQPEMSNFLANHPSVKSCSKTYPVFWRLWEQDVQHQYSKFTDYPPTSA